MDQSIIDRIFSPEVQQYLRDNAPVDVNALILKNKSILGVPAPILADQISGRRKAKDKIPSFYNAEIVYPPGVNLEQSSSEQTATFKAKILMRAVPICKRLIDLTGGFGVDSFFLSKVFKAVQYIEPNPGLYELVRKNHEALGAYNISHHNTTAEHFLSEEDEASAIFIDPSRRKEAKKVFAFADCEPNIVTLQDEIFRSTSVLLVKASPMMDLKLAIQELRFVQQVFVLSVNDEVKELLFLCRKGFSEEPNINAVNLTDSDSESFAFKFSDEGDAESKFSDPGIYIYEPYSSILKAGAFKSIGVAYNLQKIQVNTHLYTSDSLVSEFPGRIFKILAHVKPDKKEVVALFPGAKANVVTRNYPLSPEELKKKTRLSDGGEKYLLGFSGETKKFVLCAERVK